MEVPIPSCAAIPWGGAARRKICAGLSKIVLKDYFEHATILVLSLRSQLIIKPAILLLELFTISV